MQAFASSALLPCTRRRDGERREGREGGVRVIVRVVVGALWARGDAGGDLGRSSEEQQPRSMCDVRIGGGVKRGRRGTKAVQALRSAVLSGRRKITVQHCIAQ